MREIETGEGVGIVLLPIVLLVAGLADFKSNSDSIAIQLILFVLYTAVVLLWRNSRIIHKMENHSHS